MKQRLWDKLHDVVTTKKLKDKIQSSLDKVQNKPVKSKPVNLSQMNEVSDNNTIIVFGTMFQLDVALKTCILIAVLLVIIAVVAILFYFFCYKTAANEARTRKREALIVKNRGNNDSPEK